MKPPASSRPIPKQPVTAMEILNFEYEEALTALADYDGPIRSLLERIIGSSGIPGVIPQELLTQWGREAKEIMNVIYKVNGLEQRWAQ